MTDSAAMTECVDTRPGIEEPFKRYMVFHEYGWNDYGGGLDALTGTFDELPEAEAHALDVAKPGGPYRNGALILDRVEGVVVGEWSEGKRVK